MIPRLSANLESILVASHLTEDNSPNIYSAHKSRLTKANLYNAANYYSSIRQIQQ